MGAGVGLLARRRRLRRLGAVASVREVWSKVASWRLTSADISPRAYVFVEERRFLEPVRPKTVVVNNTTIINKTVNITKIKVVNKTVINEGPRTTVIEQASGRKVQAVPVRELRRKEEAAVVTKQRIAPTSNEKKSPGAGLAARLRRHFPQTSHVRLRKPVITTAEPQPPVTKKDIRQADEQDRAAKLVTEQRARQEKARATESEKGQLAAERRAAIQEQKEQKAAEKTRRATGKSGQRIREESSAGVGGASRKNKPQVKRTERTRRRKTRTRKAKSKRRRRRTRTFHHSRLD